jgi:hypothetical protein
VIQIGAVEFNRETGELGKEFKVNVDAQSAVNSGATLNASTIEFWMKQNDDARNSVMASPKIPIYEAFDDLNKFLSRSKYIWSHATFDFVILCETLRRLKIKPKFSYRSARDIRTLVDLSGGLTTVAREGTHHDALDDAKFQAKYCSEMLQRIKL